MTQQKIYAIAAAARINFAAFVKACNPQTQLTDFHITYYTVLQAFADGRIKKLIISMPPQHGKSFGSTVNLPAYLFGKNPDLNIAIGSYSFALARKFNKHVQRIMESDAYSIIFERTKLKGGSKGLQNYAKTTEEFDIIGYKGNLRSIGREGSLTGNRVDIMIIDDLYKDAMEGNSPTIRDNAWDWYTSTVKTRLHNNSQELIVFTRWHEDDLIGRIERNEKVIDLVSLNQIDDHNCWYKLNFEAIKQSDPTSLDPRSINTALWPIQHSLDLLNEKRNLDIVQFDCMYQGNPINKEGLLYGDNFKIYDTLPEYSQIIKIANYTDTADTGADYLCSICYSVDKEKKIYVLDVLYTVEPMEVTESATASMLKRNSIRVSYIESNNGGRGFARVISKSCPSVKIDWFHQSENKESRILTNSATVINSILMPFDWRLRWPEFYQHLTMYKRIFSANRHDDAPDALTGIVEKEILKPQGNTSFHFTKQ